VDGGAVVLPAALAVEVRALLAPGLRSTGGGVSPAVRAWVHEVDALVRRATSSGPRLIGTTEAADRLGVSPRRVRQLIDSGRLPAASVRPYLVDRDDVEALADFRDR